MIKLRRAIFSILFISLFLCLFISCPAEIPDWMNENGQEIKNFPEWTTSCSAFSNWMDWQSDNGKKLHAMVGDSIISDDFSGKFRIALRGQNITIGFNNSKGDFIKLYNWYGEIHNWNDSVVFVEQTDPNNKYVYDCYCKTQKSDDATENNKSKVEMTRKDNNSFHYKQTVAGITIIDCDFYNIAFYCKDPDKDTYTEPTDIPVVLNKYFPINFFINEGESFLCFWPVDGSESYKRIAAYPHDLFMYIYCPEGYSFREINEEKNRISFNLLDSAESDYIDYFEIQVNSKKDVKIHFYKTVEGNTILLNTLEKPELKFEWLLNSETGETIIY